MLGVVLVHAAASDAGLGVLRVHGAEAELHHRGAVRRRDRLHRDHDRGGAGRGRHLPPRAGGDRRQPPDRPAAGRRRRHAGAGRPRRSSSSPTASACRPPMRWWRSATCTNTASSAEQLAAIAVTQRAYAAKHPHAHMREPITLDDVMKSRTDRCAAQAAGLLPGLGRRRGRRGERRRCRSPTGRPRSRILGAGQGHTHEHISAAPSLLHFGCEASARQAFARAGVAPVRHRRRRDLQLVHHHARGRAGIDGLLRQGRGRARRRPPASLGRRAACPATPTAASCRTDTPAPPAACSTWSRRCISCAARPGRARSTTPSSRSCTATAASCRRIARWCLGARQ